MISSCCFEDFDELFDPRFRGDSEQSPPLEKSFSEKNSVPFDGLLGTELALRYFVVLAVTEVGDVFEAPSEPSDSQ